MTTENRFQGLMGVVGKQKSQTSNHSDVQKPRRRKKQSSKANTETSNHSDVQTSEIESLGLISDISTSKHLDAQTSKKAKSANPDYTRTTMYLPKKMHKQLKAIALDEEKEMSSIVEELIDSWLNSRR